MKTVVGSSSGARKKSQTMAIWTSVILAVAFSVLVFEWAQAATDPSAGVRQFRAQYTVPVSEPKLQDVASFDLEAYTIDFSNEASGQAEMNYQIPETLLGYRHDVQLYMTAKRQDQIGGKPVIVREFAGRDAGAVCQGPWDQMRCEVKFNLKPDLAALEAILRSARDARASDRIEVARRFENDPIGITQVR